MRRMLTLATLMSTAFAAAVLAAADQKPATRPATAPVASTAPATKPAVAAKPVNKFCAVEKDNEVDPKVKTVTYKGQTIGFCCPSCIEEFEKTPEKFMAGLK